MQCSKCKTSIDAGEAYTHGQGTLCEDCYLDVVAKPQACDPWAVYSAQNTAEQDSGLTETQQRILDLITETGPLTQEDICAKLGLTPEEFSNNFATLRHLGLGRACQVQGQKRFTRFDDTEH